MPSLSSLKSLVSNRRLSPRGGGRNSLRRASAMVDLLEERRLFNSLPLFLPQVQFNAGAVPTDIVTADFNRDGKADLLVATNDGFVSSLLGDGAGHFNLASRFFIGQSPRRLSLGDFNNDGKPDFAALTKTGFAVVQGLGDGQFNIGTFLYAPGTQTMALIDWNNDGNLDVAVGQGSILGIYLGTGAADAFPSQPTTTIVLTADHNVPIENLRAADMNGNGLTDLVFTTAYTSESSDNYRWNGVYCLLNTGDGSTEGTFGVLLLENKIFAYTDLALGNWDGVGGGDYIADLSHTPVAGGWYYRGENGDGFTAVFQPDFNGDRVAIGDFTGEGRDDFLMMRNDAVLDIQRGNGTGPSGIRLSYPIASAANAVAHADFNGDGIPDIAIADSGSSTFSLLLSYIPKTLYVTTTTDEDDGTIFPNYGTGTSLREALTYANDNGGNYTIAFQLPNGSAPILQLNSPLQISDPGGVTIQAPTGGVTLSGKNAVRALQVESGGKVTLNGITVSNGLASDFGAGALVKSGGTLNVNGATFFSNSSVGGGSAIRNQGTLNVVNSTFTANKTTGTTTGGAIYNEGTANINFSTIANNTSNTQAAGVVQAGQSLVLNNTIVANNTGTTSNFLITGGTASGANNIVTTGVTTGLTNTITSDPLLGTLSLNAGPAMSIPLRTNSPALNAAVGSSVTVDQRGVARPQGSAPDIGAFEAKLSPAVALTNSSLSVSPTSPAIDLASATLPTPVGGTFSGPGVNNGQFNPAGLTPGQKVITYLYTAPGADVGSTATVVINVRTPGTVNSATVSVSPSLAQVNEGQAFVVTVAISQIRNVNGDAYIPDAGSIVLSAPGMADQTLALSATQLGQASISVPFNVTFADDNATGTPSDVVQFTASVALDTYRTTSQASVTVNNVAPSSLQLAAPASVRQGEAFNLNGSFIDPGTLDTHTVTIDWKDGSTPTVLNLGANVLNFTAPHTYATQVSGPSSYAIAVSVVDDDTGAVSGAKQIVVVRDKLPVVVTTTVDEDNGSIDPTLGNGTSLREALTYAQAPIAIRGFGYADNSWTLNHSSSGPAATVVGGGDPINDVMVLTTNNANEANAAWANQRVNVNHFSADFVYVQAQGNNGADGFTFTIQDSGLNALGGIGGGLGYSGITNSFAIGFNLFNQHVQGYATYSNGVTSGNFTALGNGISLTNGIPIAINVTSNGPDVTLTMKQSGNTFTTTFANVNLAAKVGGDTAFVGFTGGTGAYAANQNFSNFSLTSAPIASIVTFAPALAGQTVSLSKGWSGVNDASSLVISNDVTLQGPTSGAGVTLSIAPGAQRRHLYVEGTGTLTINNLTLTNGYANIYGGAIWSLGSLTIRNSTLTGNQSSGEGGAIDAWQGSPLLRLENTTLAGNSAGAYGAALSVGSLNASFDHVTIVDNTCPSANGTLSIYDTSILMRNSIIARNTNDGVTTSGGNGSGTFAAGSSNNLLGIGAWPGLTDGVNSNRLGLSADDLKLGTLASNGGTTQTIALLPNSPAINAGIAIAGITTDQRGTARPQGIAPDIGAYERTAFTPHPMSLSYEYQTRQAININLDADGSVTFDRSAVVLTNLTTGQTIPAGTITFDPTGTVASLLVTNQLANGNYRATAGGQSVDFFVLKGDVNHDRVVDFSDLVILAQHYTQSGRSNGDGDANYDGIVDFSDLAILSQNYSTTIASTLASSASRAGSVDKLNTKRPPSVLS